MRPFLAAATLTALFVAGPLLAATTLYVDDDAPGDPGPGDPTVSDPLEDGSPEHPFDAIREGIDAAVATDTVLVKDGTYTGTGNRNLDFGGKAITVQSEHGAATCIIDCKGSGRGFYFHSGETAASLVDGFTIMNGDVIADGGGICCRSSSSPTITNCLISGNMGGNGGGFFCDNSSPTITNCTIMWNLAQYGGGVCCWRDSNLTVTNCVLWGNAAHHGDEIALRSIDDDDPSLTVRYSDVQGGAGEAYVESGCTLDLDSTNVDADPLVTPDGHLTVGSPCIDRCATGPANDEDAEARPVDIVGVGNEGVDTYDIGADEFVDGDGDGLPDWWELEHFGSATAADPGVDEEPDGLTNVSEYELSTNPHDEDSDGDGRLDGTEVAENTHPAHPDNTEKTYYVNGDSLVGDDSYDGLAAAYDGVHGPKRTIQAGVDATLTGWDYTVQVADGTYTGMGNKGLDFVGKAVTVESENGAETCIIDCEDDWTGFYIVSGETAASVIDGFTITNGSYECGGGVWCVGSSPTIRNCTITDSTGAHGGGIYCASGSSPTIANCTITGNSAGCGGGIACFTDSSPVIVDCTIADNTAGGPGGGIACFDASNPTITNCIITGNSTPYRGGGLYCWKGCSPATINCTIAANSADGRGGGICCQENSSPSVTNCILWGNVSPLGHEIAVRATLGVSSLTITYSDVEGGAADADVESGCTLDFDATNIDQDPLLSVDWHLLPGSPCIDWCPTGPATDIDGGVRPFDVVGVGYDGERLYDIGADEHRDSDGDGMSDAWEDANGLNPNDATDALLDSDGDWLLNVEEFGWQADPQDPASPAFVYVDDDNLGAPAQDGTAAHPYGTIQLGIDAAMAPAVVKVLPGSYAEGVVLKGGVWVVGSGPSSTTIDLLNGGEAVYADGVTDCLVAGFTITSGIDYDAVRTTNSTLTLRACVITASKNGCGVDGGGLLRLNNCLVAGHAVSGLWQNGSVTDVELVNCTVCDNGSYGVARWCSGPATITIRDTIVCGNGDDISGDPAGYAVSYSDIGDGDFAGVDGNISADPVFVSGALHGYYLSQIAAGQAVDSPCVETGSHAADGVGMGWLSTRTDQVGDTGTVDMGYHTAYALRITSIARTGWDITIEWNGLAGKSYVVEGSADMGTWYEMPVGEVSSWTHVSAVAQVDKFFYRVREDEAAASMSSSHDDATGQPITTSRSGRSDGLGSGPQRRGNVRRGWGNVSRD